MVRHCRVVHERRCDHKCPRCSSRFGTASGMRPHCAIVHDLCPYCDSVAFGREDTLNTHIDTVHFLKLHDHARPCCKGLAFGRKGDLTVHLDTVHLERREHACPYCPGVAYLTKSYLTSHIETVHEKRRERAATALASPSG